MLVSLIGIMYEESPIKINGMSKIGEKSDDVFFP
jgi:hypothetical protein